jgi:hypothetical protein
MVGVGAYVKRVSAKVGGCFLKASFPPGLMGNLCEFPINVVLFIIIIVRTSSDYMTG